VKPEDIFKEEIILEEEILQEGDTTKPEIKRQVSFIRDYFIETQLGDKKVGDIIEDDEKYPKVDDKIREILDRMDRESRDFWIRHIREIVKGD